MADYKDQIMSSLKAAMKAKDTQKRNALRMLQAAVKQVEIDEQKDLSTEEEMEILIKEAKKRRESIDELEGAGRGEEAEDERYELELITSFLPEQLSREEVEAMAKEAIEQTGATEQRDMGKVMGMLSPKTKGRADGKMVSTIVRELLTQ